MIAPLDVDKYREANDVAQAQVTQALETVYQIASDWGYGANPKRRRRRPGESSRPSRPDLLDRPPGAYALLQSVAPLNYFPVSYEVTPKQAIEQFYRQIRKKTSTAFSPSSSRGRRRSSSPRQNATKPRPTSIRPNSIFATATSLPRSMA